MVILNTTKQRHAQSVSGAQQMLVSQGAAMFVVESADVLLLSLNCLPVQLLLKLHLYSWQDIWSINLTRHQNQYLPAIIVAPNIAPCLVFLFQIQCCPFSFSLLRLFHFFSPYLFASFPFFVQSKKRTFESMLQTELNLNCILGMSCLKAGVTVWQVNYSILPCFQFNMEDLFVGK